jgi:hypothetical protein
MRYSLTYLMTELLARFGTVAFIRFVRNMMYARMEGASRLSHQSLHVVACTVSS